MLLNCGAGEDSWESLGLQGDQTSQLERKSTLNIHCKDWCRSWSSNNLATCCKKLTHWRRLWCWKRLEGRKEKGEQRMRLLDSITNSIDLNLSKLWDNPCSTWDCRVGHNLVTKQQETQIYQIYVRYIPAINVQAPFGCHTSLGWMSYTVWKNNWQSPFSNSFNITVKDFLK